MRVRPDISGKAKTSVTDSSTTFATTSAAGHIPPKPRKAQGRYIKPAVYGGLDGAITTFAVVAGASGASLSSGVMLILGFANLIADGLSMSVGDYLSSKSEREYEESERMYESWEFDHDPKKEHEELVHFYERRGVPVKDSKTIANILIRDKKTVVDLMMVEEHGILESKEHPMRSAIVTFCSFVCFGIIPLLTYLIAPIFPIIAQNSFLVACILTGLTLFALGASKTYITGRNWFISGLEILLLGGVAAAAAYGIGAGLAFLV